MHISINVDSGVPIYLQIAGQIQQMAAAGGIRPGEKLPSVRKLAVALRVNPNTIQAAYRHLEAEGTVEKHQGLGVFLRKSVPKMPLNARRKAVSAILDEAVVKARQVDLALDELPPLLESRIASLSRKQTRPLTRTDTADADKKEGGPKP